MLIRSFPLPLSYLDSILQIFGGGLNIYIYTSTQPKFMQQTERSFQTKPKFFFLREYSECQLRYMALDRCSLILFYF